MKEQEFTSTPQFVVDGSALDTELEDRLQWCEIALSIYRAGTVRLVFRDPDYGSFDADVLQIGKPLEVKLPIAATRTTTVFSGELVGIGIEQAPGGKPRLTVEAKDARHRFTGRSHIRTYLNQSRTDIIARLIGDYELSADIEDMSDPEEEYLLQTGTDAVFMDQLTAALGCFWFVDGQTVHVRRRREGAGPKLQFADDSLLSFSARYCGEVTPKTVTVRGWDPTKLEPIVQRMDVGSPEQFGVVAEEVAFVGQAYSRMQKRSVDIEVPTTGVLNGTEAGILATSIAHSWADQQLELKGVASPDPEIKPGGSVTIDQVGDQLRGTYYLTDVTHVFGVDQQLETRFSYSPPRDPARQHSSLPGAADGWGAGLALGIVSDTKDPEDLGRVRVALPELGDSIVSHWARVVMPGASDGFGMHIVPQVGDEVLVGFHRGDFRNPFVIGGMYSDQHRPAELIGAGNLVENGDVTAMAITSRAKHQIVLSDGKGDDHCISILTGNGETKIILGEKGIAVEAKSGPIAVKTGKASLTITDAGDVEISCEKFTVDAKKTVTVKTQDKVALEGTLGFEAKGMAVKLKGQSEASLESGGQTTVKGSMVMIN